MYLFDGSSICCLFNVVKLVFGGNVFIVFFGVYCDCIVCIEIGLIKLWSLL